MLRKRKTLVEWFQSKAMLQLFSLLVAIVAWAIVNSGQVVQQRRTIHLQYIQLPKDLVFQRSPLKEIKVDLTGSLYRIRSIPDEDLTYQIDLSNAKAGVVHVEMDVENLRLPLDVEASHLNPRAFNIHLEEVYMRPLPLKPVYIGAPKEGYQVGVVKLTPENISVTGPKSIISKLSQIEVEVPLMNRELSFSETVKPRLNFPGAEAVESVFVEVEIVPQKLRQEFSSVPVSLGTGRPKVRITPAKGKIILEGPEVEIRAIESNLKIMVPFDGLKRGRYRLRAQVPLSGKLKLISIEPESYLVEVLQEGVRK
ncbi:MAG: YbbR-like protein [Bacteriovoracaceae bacterium]|nr:YbbR-like protein [Bacteriovoracaceae bacterium]